MQRYAVVVRGLSVFAAVCPLWTKMRYFWFPAERSPLFLKNGRDIWYVSTVDNFCYLVEGRHGRFSTAFFRDCAPTQAQALYASTLRRLWAVHSRLRAQAVHMRLHGAGESGRGNGIGDSGFGKGLRSPARPGARSATHTSRAASVSLRTMRVHIMYLCLLCE